MRGDAAASLRFYRLLADAMLFLLLDEEADGDQLTPKVFDLESGPLLLAFDSEERLASFGTGPQPYAALPGRIIVAQMAGQGQSAQKRLSLGLNLGTGAASEVILPPEALDWLMQMLDQQVPEALEARVAGFVAPMVPAAVQSALAPVLVAGMRGYLVGVRYVGGRQGQMLALTGVIAAAEGRVARAVTEALAFSGVAAGALDVTFLAEGHAMIDRMTGVALLFEGVAVDAPEPVRRAGPGMDPDRPPVLR